MKPPTSFAAAERAFSNTGFLRSELRTGLSYEGLHRLLDPFIYYWNLPHADMDAIPDGSGGGARRHAAGDCVGVENGADGASVGSDGELSHVGDVTWMLAVDLREDEWLMLEWRRDASASAVGEDPTT